MILCRLQIDFSDILVANEDELCVIQSEVKRSEESPKMR